MIRAYFYKGQHRMRRFSIRVVDLEPSYAPEGPYGSLGATHPPTYTPIDRWRRLKGMAPQAFSVEGVFAAVDRMWDERGAA